MSSSNVVNNIGAAGLPSWRDVMEPHPDVAQGLYRNAEFAADLSRVAKGEATSEYQDPVEFFSRTYVTVGMKGLLTHALKRVTGQGGEPVLQLKTAFGGGKTHTMLALYHLLKKQVDVEHIPAVKPILQAVNINELPKAHVAVIVGTALNPSQGRRPKNYPGITINTIWGDIAAQLAESAGDMGLYELVREADKKGVSPGSDVLTQLFDACGSCLVLMDELVAYGKKLYGAEKLAAGTFDNFVTFIQEIAEAATKSKSSLIVASLPESEKEVGDGGGKEALAAVEHTFGRQETIWKPVEASEGFEVVRRRLFVDCKDTKSRDAICTAFSLLYNANAAEFPTEAKEITYRDQMIACYPIHPEVFEKLYKEWSTLERFQRTRGVLRLMAAVIHELWMAGDNNHIIMPGSLPLDKQSVTAELTQYLNADAWNAIMDKEVDGKHSVPYQTDEARSNYGQFMACRRVARSIFMGSAPTTSAQGARGVDMKWICLSTIMPGETISTFKDAVATLKGSLSYLYSDGTANSKYWYDTKPTLNKLAEDRATQINEMDVNKEIENRLHKIHNEIPFMGVHICPKSSLDIPDAQNLRLVIVEPQDTFSPSSPNSSAIDKVNDFIQTRGENSPRIYRNMLAFVVADSAQMTTLKKDVCKYLAWVGIKDDANALNLDMGQLREIEGNIGVYTNNIDVRIRDAYKWLFVPHTTVDNSEIEWERSEIAGSGESILKKAGRKMESNEQLIKQWSPLLLQAELDNLLWKDKEYLSVKDLWNYLTSYCYLPRLTEREVLDNAILEGVKSKEYFALASGISEGRYVDLKIGENIYSINPSDILVKANVALKQLEEEKAKELPHNDQNHGEGGQCATQTYPGTQELLVKPGVKEPNSVVNCHFAMLASIDSTKIIKEVGKIVDEVINNLNSLPGCNVSIKLEVTANTSEGFNDNVVRNVSENCKTLGIEDFKFI